MKTIEQIDYARDRVIKELSKPGLSYDQEVCLKGMSVALCWVADDGGTTLQRIVDKEPITRPTGMTGFDIENLCDADD